MDNLIISFFAGGFREIFTPLTQAIYSGFDSTNKLITEKFMTLQEQIAQLKAGEELNSQKIDDLTSAIASEREQVGALVGAVSSQQTTIAELNTRVAELTAALDAKTSEEQAAIDAVASVTASAVANSEKIAAAIASVQGIYEPV